ncbi:nucleotidyltransferase [Ornithinibacillus salinisoli]|uniref:Nucleotidyltransferase n=1 Tax=Ornithinibacillus salinisoli TaxID=1848459 RepID=A0ABW4VXP1_9BACI
MAQIKEIGRFCPTDTKGYIINDSRLSNIKPDFYKVIEKVIEKYQTHLREDLHSIYIRGSIPRGLGIDSVSDLDTIAITNKDTNDIDLKWVDKAEQELNKKYSCVNGVELSFYYHEDILETNIFSIIPFMIKTHSVCVYGEDLSVHLPNYKADKTLGNEHLVNLKKQIQQAKDDLVGNDDLEDILDCCGWIMKIIVRAGLALVIEEENKYTRDLFPAYRIFAEHYPEKDSEMKQALKYAINPVENPNEIVDFLNEMGNWMIIESEKWLQVHNPKKVSTLEI